MHHCLPLVKEKTILLKRRKMLLVKAARQKCEISRKLLRISKKHKTQVGGRATEGVKTGQPSLSTRMRKSLQEQLNAVKDAAFLVDDNNILREALSGVKVVYDMLTKNSPKNHGLSLRNSPVKNKLKLNQVEYHQVFHKKLPKRRKWKKRTSTPIVLLDELEGRRKIMSEFARCLCEESSVDAAFDIATERARITSMVFGCCYGDIHEYQLRCLRQGDRPLEEFVTEARLLIEDGGYDPAVKERTLRDTLVLGVTSDKVIKDAIALGNQLTFKQVYDLAKVEESTKAHMKIISKGEEKSDLHAVDRRPARPTKNTSVHTPNSPPRPKPKRSSKQKTSPIAVQIKRVLQMRKHS
ncbi:hypothetical protein AWC38_SpisGene145 [Stylophora pistillata]|uniref:Retrotransposon gag domain-containing protein n=1 Tax=Stylophora pistillata TaxID=50429 RepID=A0A2B4SZX0_STYPI|nr:hypothetical protein AWC38_SpisGene145 [Stylophora pistillata]